MCAPARLGAPNARGLDIIIRSEGHMKRFVLLLATLLFSAFALAAVNINTATREELDALPGIGPVKSQAIIDYRTKNGPFKTPEDIMKVSGIKEGEYSKLKGLISVTGPTTPIAAPATKESKAAPAPAKAPETKMAPPPAPAPATAEAKKEDKAMKAPGTKDMKSTPAAAPPPATKAAPPQAETVPVPGPGAKSDKAMKAEAKTATKDEKATKADEKMAKKDEKATKADEKKAAAEEKAAKKKAAAEEKAAKKKAAADEKAAKKKAKEDEAAAKKKAKEDKAAADKATPKK